MIGIVFGFADEVSIGVAVCHLKILVNRLPIAAGGFSELLGELIEGARVGWLGFHRGSDDDSPGDLETGPLQGFLHGVERFATGEDVIDKDQPARGQLGFGGFRNMDDRGAADLSKVADPVFGFLLGENAE